MADSKKEESGSVLDTIIPLVGELLSPSTSTKKTTTKKTTAKKTTATKKTTAAKKTSTAKKSTAAKKTTTAKKTSGASSKKSVEPKSFTVTVGKKKFTYADVVKKVNSSYKDKIKTLTSPLKPMKARPIMS